MSRNYCEACGYTDSHDPNCPVVFDPTHRTPYSPSAMDLTDPSLHLIFTSGDADALKIEMGDRRFALNADDFIIAGDYVLTESSEFGKRSKMLEQFRKGAQAEATANALIEAFAALRAFCEPRPVKWSASYQPSDVLHETAGRPRLCMCHFYGWLHHAGIGRCKGD